MQLSPALAEARLLHGVILGQQNRLTEAVAQFREALRLNPKLLDARVNLGLALMKAGQADEALKEFEAALHQTPAEPRALKYARALREKLAAQPQP